MKEWKVEAGVMSKVGYATTHLGTNFTHVFASLWRSLFSRM